MLPVPLRRDRFTTEVGPDDSGSKPGIEGCNHLPEISGIDASLSLPLLADPSVGAADCPKTGVAVAAASVTTKRKSRCTPRTVMRCDFIFPPSIEVVPDSSRFYLASFLPH